MNVTERWVDLWLGPSFIDEAASNFASGLLSSDETNRARRFHFDRDRKRFMAARAELRLVLAEYTGGSPGTIQFQYGPYGKPELKCRESRLHFNLSHAGDYVVIAVTVGMRVGVDLERMEVDRKGDLDRCARQFCEREQDYIFGGKSSPLGRAERFYRIWTRKEAVLKAVGIGLGGGLDSFQISVNDSKVVARQGDFWLGSRWFVQDFNTPAGYAGAVVTEGVLMPIRYRRRRVGKIEDRMCIS